MPANTQKNAQNELILVTTANGKTGQRVARELEAMGKKVRRGSRSADLPFDWNKPETWKPVLEGVTAAYVVYIPDLAVPAAPATITAFSNLAREMGVQKLVLLSGRGEEKAQLCEQIVMDAGMAWTIVRTSWFNQNFSEGEFLELIQQGTIALPAKSVAEPFVDVNDIADVVVASLTEVGHDGQVYEVTGPRLLTFQQVADELSDATGRQIDYVPITSEQFQEALHAQQVDGDFIWLLNYLFTEVLDGRNAQVCDGVQRALGRPARDFGDFAQSVAQTGLWQEPATV